MAKVVATQALQFCADQAVQILGGMGYMRGTASERLYREVKVMMIGGGSEEIMKDLAARKLGLRLHEYRIDQVLGQGGFGITYLATDTHLNTGVAIKEYLPAEIAFRAGDHSVSPNASRHRDRYRQGLESFLVEARTLASLRHPAIVRVARFFEAHQTAYMVMELEQGQPFKHWWPEQRGLDEAALVERLLPLLDGLAAVHEGGFLHRDIKPENIQVRSRDGSLVLLDFGSAGQTVALAEPDSVVLTPGYAPIEQYGLGRQGPWTDVYALGATLYWAVTGRKPPDAEMRAATTPPAASASCWPAAPSWRAAWPPTPRWRPGWPRRNPTRRRRCCSACRAWRRPTPTCSS
jgi:serine/threonine protein kinase